MKVLFSHGYYYPLDAKQWKQGTPFAPLGTMYAAAYSREKGHDVSLYDVGLKTSPIGITSRLSPDLEALVIYDDGFNYLTKMCLTTMREATFEMIQLAVDRQIPVIVCSSDSTDHYQKYIEKGAQVVLIGEGEESLIEVLYALQTKAEMHSIHGIAFMHERELVVTPKRKVIRNLDVLPIPAWDLVDVEAYRQVWQNKGHKFQLNIATTRGCPYQCNWCAKPIYGQRYNVRSPQKVIEEVAFLSKQFGVSNFWMCDDIFGLKPGWVQLFNALLKENNLSIQYKIQSRADLLLKEDNIEALVQSGLHEAWMGAESGSQTILDAMDKGTQVSEIKEATALLKMHGVEVGHFLQFGYLGETEKDIQATFKLLDETQPDHIGVSVSYPLPGTPFYEKVKSQLGDKANWTDSDDLALMFQNTFNQTYYRVLHKYIHKRFRWNAIKAKIKNRKYADLTPKQLLQLLLFPLIMWRYKLILTTQKNRNKHVDF